MNITWYGNSLFRINIQKDKNSSVDLVINPFDKNTGLKPPKIKADVLLLSDKEALKNTENISGDPFLIYSAGEYEVKGVFIHGLLHKKNEIIYLIESEEITVCYLDDLKEKDLTAEELEKIGSVDILLIPVGGGSTIDAKGASQIISQIEPRIVIPMNYKVPGIKEKKEGVEEFLKAMGVDIKERLPKLSIKKRDISPEGEMSIIVLDQK